MSMAKKIILVLLCTAVLLLLPFAVSSPVLEGEIKLELMDEQSFGEEEEEEEIDFGRLFFSTALAEDELIEETWTEGELHIDPQWALPFDFTVPPKPKAENYTENGYEDQSIRVTVETREMYGATVDIAHVEIASPTQIRTAIHGKLMGDSTGYLKNIAESCNAVIAMNGDLYSQVTEKKRFEYRMTNKIRSKTNKTKDVLIIDSNGDFHLFIRSVGLAEFPQELQKSGRQLINAFMFGPALVKDGELLSQEKEYDWHRTGKEPRSAIGQTGPLQYVMVIVEAKDRGQGGGGATHEELARIMYDLGCVQAYNLDGGNSTGMLMLQPEGDRWSIKFKFNGDQPFSDAKERPQKDIIYFATAVPE